MLEVNGKRSTGKRIRALNICYFLMTDQVEKENKPIKYFPTDEMWGNLMTKLTQGAKFRNFRNHVGSCTRKSSRTLKLSRFVGIT